MLRSVGLRRGGQFAPPQPSATTFLYVSDLHYNSTKSASGDRHYQDGLQKLGVAVAAANNAQADFAILNGDYIDHDGAYSSAQAADDLAQVEAVFSQAQMTRLHALGNHEVDKFTKAAYVAATGMPGTHYALTVNGHRIIVLDACYNSDDDDDPYAPGSVDWTKAYIPPAERSWLVTELSTHASLPTLVFCHQQLCDVTDDSGAQYRVGNASAVRSILETAGNVAAVFTGHEHRNGRVTQNGIPYYLMAAATEGAYPAHAHALVTVTHDGSITVEGASRQATYGYPTQLQPRFWVAADAAYGGDGALLGGVKTWRDVSGHQQHPTATGTARPTLQRGQLNGRAVTTWDGTNAIMTLPDGVIPTGSDPYHVAVVAMMDDASTSSRVLLGQGVNSANQYVVARVAASYAAQVGWWSNNLTAAAGSVTNQAWQLVEYTWDGTTRRILVDGVLVASDTPGSVKNTGATGARLGGVWESSSGRWKGRIAEVLVLDSASAAQAQATREYLADKWGLIVS